MTEEKIEELLRKAPTVEPPARLLQRLRDDVKLPRGETTDYVFDSRPWLRRWMPALSFAAFFLGCVVVIGVQTNILSGLQNENERLRAGTQDLELLRADNARQNQLLAESQDPAQLARNNDELARLRIEVAQLRAQIAEADRLRAENLRLQQEITLKLAAQNAGVTASLDEAIAKAKEKAEATACINNLKQLGIAFKVWAQDHPMAPNDSDGYFPDNFVTLSNELAFKATFLLCPGDKSRTAGDWAGVAAGNVSYRIVSKGPGVNEKYPELVLVLCPIHGNVTLADTSVHVLGSNAQSQLKTEDGKTSMIRKQ